MKKRKKLFPVTFLFVLLFLINLSCGSKENETGGGGKEESLTFVQEDLLKIKTPSVPVEMEIKLFEKSEFANDQYYFEAGLTSPEIVETIASNRTSRKAFAQYCTPRSEWNSRPSRAFRLATAISKAGMAV